MLDRALVPVIVFELVIVIVLLFVLVLVLVPVNVLNLELVIMLVLVIVIVPCSCAWVSAVSLLAAVYKLYIHSELQSNSECTMASSSFR